MAELKNGEFGVDMEKEKILWTDRKRHTIFALPISFTKYTLTETKLIIQKGFFNLREDEIQLYRVRDLALSQSFLERIGKVGTIHLCSMDSMTPELDIRHVKKPREVKELLSKTVEGCRKANAANAMKGSKVCTQITFAASECERSELAKEAIKRMQIKGKDHNK